MENFENVTIRKAANVYFDGKVTSRQITLSSGEVKTLGVMLPGEYTFNTDAPELMEVLGGEVDIRLKGQEGFTLYKAGEAFNVDGNSSFELKVHVVFDYICSFLAVS